MLAGVSLRSYSRHNVTSDLNSGEPYLRVHGYIQNTTPNTIMITIAALGSINDPSCTCVHVFFQEYHQLVEQENGI